MPVSGFFQCLRERTQRRFCIKRLLDPIGPDACPGSFLEGFLVRSERGIKHVKINALGVPASKAFLQRLEKSGNPCLSSTTISPSSQRGEKIFFPPPKNPPPKDFFCQKKKIRAPGGISPWPEPGNRVADPVMPLRCEQPPPALFAYTRQHPLNTSS